MLEALNKNQEISDFLARYPTRQWKPCLEALVMIGIHTLRDYQPLEELQRLAQVRAPLRRSQPESPVRPAPSNARSSSAPHQRVPPPSKPPTVQRSIPRAPVQRWNEGTPRFKQEVQPVYVQELEVSRKGVSSKAAKTLPRYLQSVESKIKGDVKKDIAYYRYQTELKPQPETRPIPSASLRSSGSLMPQQSSSQHDSPRGSQMHLESLTEHRPPTYLSRAADILPRPLASERTFLTEPNTSLKHADELFSQVSDTSFQKPIREETDTQVRRLNPRSREPVFIEEKSRESAYSEEETGDLIHIAEDFLRDPLMVHLSRKDVGTSQETHSPPSIDTSTSQLSFKQRWDDTSHPQDWESSPQRSSASPDGLYYTSMGSYRVTPSSSLSYNPRADAGSYRFL